MEIGCSIILEQYLSYFKFLVKQPSKNHALPYYDGGASSLQPFDMLQKENSP